MNRVLGSPVDRADARLKVTGEARYAADFSFEGLAYGVPIQSTIARGRVVRVDDSEARKAPGILAIITRENAPKLYRVRSDFESDLKPGEARMVFEDDRVHYAGQVLGLVVAESLEEASHAATLVKVDYTEEPPVIRTEKALQHGYAPNSFFGDKLRQVRGDFSRAFSSAPVKIEETYVTPVEHHNPMEPSASIAVWEGEDLTLYESTQWIFGVKNVVASALGIPSERVRVISRYVGGGFGCKGFVWPHSILAALAAREVGRPVKVALSRKEMFSAVGHRPETVQTVSLGAAADGELLAIRHQSVSQTSTVDEYVETCGFPTRFLYACPNVEVSHRVVPVNLATPTPMRAPGEAPGLFALESALDELAYELKIDPVALRLKNHADKHPGEGVPWSSKNLKTCYEIGMEKFGWKKRNPEPQSMGKRGNKRVGWGMASATFPGFRLPASARVRILADGTALVSSATHDIGGGTYTTLAQIAAEVLGFQVERIRVELGDTRLPKAPVSGGSMTSASVGPAVRSAAQNALTQLIDLARGDPGSPLLGKKAGQVACENGMLFVKAKGSVREPVESLLSRRRLAFVTGEAREAPTEELDRYAIQSFGAQFAEVEVEPDTGEVRVTRFVGVFDVGKVLNAKTARSQAMGGIVMGIGMALMEHTEYDPVHGRVVNANLADYRVPVCADVPDIQAYFVDKPDPRIGPIGARGLGEIGITGVAAAVANAVYHATGIRVRNLPITPDKLL